MNVRDDTPLCYKFCKNMESDVGKNYNLQFK